MEEGGIHIVLAAEKLGEIWGLPITNTLITSWVVIFVLASIAFLVGRNIKLIPGKTQVLFESMFSYILDYMETTLESKSLAQKFFPFIVTLFLFIFTANILEFTPGIGSIGFFLGEVGHQEFVPIFRSVNTDLNVTLALAIISFLVIEISGVVLIGFLKYSGKFVNFKSVLGFFIGIIELFSEIARLVSFSFRLFGNIFAGEVLILVATTFVPFFLPIPLMVFEVFVGFIQAAIFSLLTLFFIKIAIAEPH
ncbi:F0F1 ATP synthase subunit A [Candidatus Kaiserbacteria bacterium]|nr:F0F1 ATP synthase subunit A [Candidatus Kaiserbacteria bacterium]